MRYIHIYIFKYILLFEYIGHGSEQQSFAGALQLTVVYIYIKYYRIRSPFYPGDICRFRNSDNGVIASVFPEHVIPTVCKRYISIGSDIDKRKKGEGEDEDEEVAIVIGI